MPSVIEMMRLARKRSKSDNTNTSARFNEILSIVMKSDLKSGLTPEKAVKLLEDLGATFVKLGQIASTHPDILPLEYCEALGALRTKVVPMDFDTVKTQVESELGKPLNELFSEFDENAVGSASIAQVHRAVLIDGTVVAVKVQRPGVVEQVTSDLAIMERLVDLYELVDRGESGLSLKELVSEMVKTSTSELDFANEEANVDRFYANNESRAKVHSPRCYHDFSTSAVLTEDYVDAPCVEEIENLGMSDAERDKLAYLIAKNYMQQMMEDGFYHADPHAGNIMILPDQSIEWIDFGMMGTMTSSQRDTLQGLISALVKGDPYGLKRSVLKVATPTGPVDHAALLEMCESLTEEFFDVDLESFDTGELLNRLVTGLRMFGFEVDPFLVNLGRGLVTLEGTIHLISPRLSIMKVLSDYATSSFDFDRMQQRAMRMIGQSVESAEAMVGLPSKLNDTLDMLQKGHARVGMDLSPTEQLTHDLRAAAGMVSLAMVSMGFVIGACFVGASSTALRIGDVPLLGTAGLLSGLAIAAYIIVKTRPYLK